MAIKICVSIRERTLEKAKKQIRRAGAHVDFIEIWLDDFPERESVKRLIRASSKPVIAVCRGREEDGRFRGSEQRRVEALKTALAEGAGYIDVGMQTSPKYLRTLKTLCRKKRAKLILSAHLWNGTARLQTLLKLIAKGKKLGADIVKIAAMVRRWSDNAVLFELAARERDARQNIIVVGMGEKGRISRIGCPLLGSYLTYAALGEKSKTAPGQLTVKEIRALHW